MVQQCMMTLYDSLFVTVFGHGAGHQSVRARILADIHYHLFNIHKDHSYLLLDVYNHEEVLDKELSTY
jgi:hypothetical protein